MSWSEWKKFGGGEPTLLFDKVINTNGVGTASGNVITDKDYSTVIIFTEGNHNSVTNFNVSYSCSNEVTELLDTGVQSTQISNEKITTRLICLKDVPKGTTITLTLVGDASWSLSGRQYIVGV